MPRYRFTGAYERVLTGLAHGVNVVLHRNGEHFQGEGVVVAQPGDIITTPDPYDHPEMEAVDDAEPVAVAAGSAPEDGPDAPAQPETPPAPQPVVWSPPPAAEPPAETV